jgi:hypothetical protein
MADKSRARIVGKRLDGGGGGAVGRAVVDPDQTERPVGLVENGADGSTDGTGSIVGWDDDKDFRWSGHG